MPGLACNLFRVFHPRMTLHDMLGYQNILLGRKRKNQMAHDEIIGSKMAAMAEFRIQTFFRDRVWVTSGGENSSSFAARHSTSALLICTHHITIPTDLRDEYEYILF